MDSLARQVLHSAQAMVPGHFRTRAASVDTHPHIAWSEYDDARRRLEALGFSHMGDVEPTSVPADPRMSLPNVMRLLVGEGGAVTAGFYRMALRWTPMGMLGRLFGGAGGMLDLITIYPDGAILETSNAAPAGVWSSPPFLHREFVARGTPVEEVVARHRERMRARAATHPAVPPVRVHSLLEVVAASDATERAKRAHRASIGWITRDELARLSRRSGAELDALEQAVRRAAAHPNAAASDPAPSAVGS